MNAVTFWKIAGFATFLKALLIPSYRSTDFEVHRNWLAITHSLSPSRWYYEDTSEWTLDYPPFFAYFEMLLSQVARFFDRKMLVVGNLNYASTATVLFQRLSVICTDFIYIYAVKKYCECCIYAQPVRTKSGGHTSPRFILTLIMLLNFGLFLVDHIHFQYNGLLFGILLLSITRIFQGRVMEGSLLFATLLNFKHIYLYIAPAYGIYLLRWYCLYNGKDHSVSLSMRSVNRLVLLAFIVLSTFAISFGPFALMGQIPQVLSRLFPFKRGLCHAYWAPNFWALYNMADKVLARAAVVSGYNVSMQESASMTGGLVQEFSHTVLPSVPPLATLILTLLAIAPALVHVWRWPTGSRGFLRCVILCAYGAFLFGWHVHEKAILIMLVPLGLLSVEKRGDGATFLFLSAVGSYSLFPLVFTSPEMPIVYCLYLLYMCVLWLGLHTQFLTSSSWYNPCPLLHPLETFYLLGLLPLELYRNGLHYTLGHDTRLPFLPLLLVSVYCSLGVVYAWLRLYYSFLTEAQLRSFSDSASAAAATSSGEGGSGSVSGGSERSDVTKKKTL